MYDIAGAYIQLTFRYVQPPDWPIEFLSRAKISQIEPTTLLRSTSSLPHIEFGGANCGVEVSVWPRVRLVLPFHEGRLCQIPGQAGRPSVIRGSRCPVGRLRPQPRGQTRQHRASGHGTCGTPDHAQFPRTLTRGLPINQRVFNKSI